MEDAMIINKASEERGLAHGSIYKSEFVVLDHPSSYFAINPENKNLSQYLDSDGLPFIGRKMQSSTPHYSFYNFDKSTFDVKFFNAKEECYVHSIKMCSNLSKANSKQMVCLTYRIPVCYFIFVSFIFCIFFFF